MKRTLIVISLFLTFFVIYFLQSNFFSWFTIAGIKPNLFIILALFIGLFLGRKYGLCFGIVYGFLLDSLIGRNIGMSSVALGVIGLMGGYIDKNFSKDSRLMIMSMVMVTTIIYEVALYIIQSVVLSYNISEIGLLIKTLFIEVIYNIIITIIIYPLIKKAGYFIQGTFKESNILTRYF